MWRSYCLAHFFMHRCISLYSRNPVQMFTELSSARACKIHSKAVTFIQSFHFLWIILFEFKSLLVEKYKLKYEERSNGRKKCVMCNYIQLTFRNICNWNNYNHMYYIHSWWILFVKSDVLVFCIISHWVKKAHKQWNRFSNGSEMTSFRV